MKVVNTGSTYVIYGDDLRTFDKLPSKVYSVGFNPNMGFFLEEHAPIEIKEEKIYGVHNEKIQKVLNAFECFERNLGVILSGKKGIGKSLFAKILSVEAIKRNIPVILVESYFNGVETFIQSIEQEVLVLFDEFDKTYGFKRDNAADPQAGLLTMFDGMASGKKMFVITCNELYSLNDYFVNRPGRFHYHLRFDYPTAEEITEYLHDKLEEKYYEEIEYVVSFASRVDLNYDCLRAIAFELNNGTPFKEAIKDLNIVNNESLKYNLTLILNNGERMTYSEYYLDLFDPQKEYTAYLIDKKRGDNLPVTFYIADCMPDYNTETVRIAGDKLALEYSYYTNEEHTKELESIGAKELIITRVMDKRLHYAV